MEERLDEFLKAFYETISFDSIDKFDSLKFENMFFQNAMLTERFGDALRSETIIEYVNRLLYEMRHFPETYDHGLNERQIRWEWLWGEDFIFVKSEFEKTYSNGEPAERGCNYFTLCADGEWFKIVSMAWASKV